MSSACAKKLTVQETFSAIGPAWAAALGAVAALDAGAAASLAAIGIVPDGCRRYSCRRAFSGGDFGGDSYSVLYSRRARLGDGNLGAAIISSGVLKQLRRQKSLHRASDFCRSTPRAYNFRLRSRHFDASDSNKLGGKAISMSGSPLNVNLTSCLKEILYGNPFTKKGNTRR